jgi:mercuric ion transport protein
MQGKTFPIVGSVGGAIMSMVCCVGPLVLSALGLGGGAVLAQLTPFRWYWIAISVVMLGIGFYLTYRPRKVACEDGTCKIERAGRWNKIAVWSATVAVAVMVALPYALGVVATQGSSASLDKAIPPASQSTMPSEPTQSQPVVNASATTVVLHQLTLSVKGMDCPACPLTVKNFIAGVPGVTSAQVTLEPPQAVVIYDAAETSPDHIVKSLKEPYTATIVADMLVKN